jgi:SP family general alpha glucoside:H+ symporter-like MFS transporter
MEAYCVFLMGNFIALPAFAREYGVYDAAADEWVIETAWQSALQMGGPIGAIIGVVIAGPITSRIGYRWAFISNLMLLNCFIFVFYFANSLPVMLAAQLLEGIPWGVFIANSPAYCSEIVPIPLRAPATQMLQMFWAIGAIIVQGVTYNYNGLDEAIAYRYESPSEFLAVFKLTNFFQSPYCLAVDVPHSSCYPHLARARVTLVAHP